jgi:hypothetical protein
MHGAKQPATTSLAAPSAKAPSRTMRTPQQDGPEERLALESVGLVETTRSEVGDLEEAAELTAELVLGDGGDGKLGLFRGAEGQQEQETSGARVRPQREQVFLEMIPACQVIAAAIDEHVEGLADPAHLGHVSREEANASAGRVIGRASPGSLDRRGGEIDSDDAKAVRREQERLDAASTAEVERRARRR